MQKIAILIALALIGAGCSSKPVKENTDVANSSYNSVRNVSKNSLYGKAITLKKYNARFAAKKPAAGRAIASTGEGCLPYTTIIHNGTAITPGTVAVSNDGTDLIVAIAADTANGWAFRSVFIYAGTGPVPMTPGGWQDLAQYPIYTYLPTTQPAYEYRIPLSTIAASCGTTLNVSVRTEMEQYDAAGTLIGSHYGFAYGPHEIGDPTAHHCQFSYTICCAPPQNSGCTYTQGYWKNHSIFASKKNKKPWPISENTMLCGMTWFNILNTPPSVGNTWMILAHQWIAAKLNVAKGASVPPIVASTLTDGGNMLANSCSGISMIDKPEAIGYSMVLDKYNNGLLGPGHCE